MKLLPAAVLLVAFVALGTAVRLPDPSWAVEIKRQKRLNDVNDDPTPAPQPAIDCKNKIFSCLDCSTSLVCRPKDGNSIVQHTTLKCPADRPYCDEASGSCVRTARSDCGKTPDDFVCLKSNYYFPDKDCAKFHYCDATNEASQFQCIGDGMIFNPEEQQCVPAPEMCGTFNCTDNALRKTPHTKYPRFYAMCHDEKSNDDAPLVVGVCPPKYRIDPKLQNCEADCESHGNGNIPDFTDCHKFFSCSKETLDDGRTYIQKKPATCPTGQAFDPNLFMCVENTDKKICNT